MLTAALEATAHVVAGAQAWTKAAEVATATNGWEPFLQYGVLGLVVVGFITGWIVPGYQAKALLAENARLTRLIEEKLLPMAETNAVTLDKAAGALQKATEAIGAAAMRSTQEQARSEH